LAALPVVTRQIQDFEAQENQRKAPRDEADLRLIYGRILLAAGRPGEAKESLEMANRLLQTQHPNSPWLAEAQISLAGCLLDLGEVPRAKQLVASARTIQAAHRQLGEHFRRPLRLIEARLTESH
jgi:hypothetical protein